MPVKKILYNVSAIFIEKVENVTSYYINKYFYSRKEELRNRTLFTTKLS